MKMNTVLDRELNHKKIFSQIAKMTDNNQHTEARLFIASMFAPQFIPTFTMIKKLHDIDGHMYSSLHAYRKEKLAEMMRYIYSSYAAYIHDNILSSL